MKRLLYFGWYLLGVPFAWVVGCLALGPELVERAWRNAKWKAMDS